MKKWLFLFLLLFPYGVFAEELIPNAKSGILIEANSGRIFFEKEKDKQLSVASMTKMVAQIIIMEEIEKDRIYYRRSGGGDPAFDAELSALVLEHR